MERYIAEIVFNPFFWIFLISTPLFLYIRFNVKRIEKKRKTVSRTIYKGETQYDQIISKVSALQKLRRRALVSKKIARSWPVRFLRYFGFFEGYRSGIRKEYKEILRVLRRNQEKLDSM